MWKCGANKGCARGGWGNMKCYSYDWSIITHSLRVVVQLSLAGCIWGFQSVRLYPGVYCELGTIALNYVEGRKRVSD